MKKILPSTLLLLGVSSTLLAQTYDRSTGGFWDDLDQWSPEKGRPRRVPNGERVQINLNNAGTNPLNLDLKGNSYVINELNVSGNAWRFSRGTLAFSTLEFVPAQIRYSGTQTLTLATALDLRAITELNVSDSAGTVRLAGMITGNGMLIKDGNGTLLIEAPFGTGSSQLYLRGGTTGIASTSLGSHDFSVVADSNLFAFNSDLYIAGTLKTFSPNIKLNVIDNPSDPTPHSVILKGDKFGDGTINQLSHGDLIFEGTDHFKGTLNTQAGYGRIILNSNTTANVQMKGGQIAGIGGTRGDLTARNGAIISPGYNGSSGTLSFRDAYFDPSTILNFKFGQSNVIGNFQNDLVQIDKNLTLAGKLGIHAAPGLGDGVYRLLNYGGTLTNNGLSILFVPNGYDASEFTVQTSISGQVNLVVGTPSNGISTIRFWDDSHTVANGTILGGNGVWNNTDTTWSGVDGLSKNRWNGYWAVFGGHAGTVDVQDDVSFRKIEFIANGYTIHSSNNSKLLANNPVAIRVNSTYQADISTEITGIGSISKRGLGTLILSHDNSYTGGTILKEGILVADTRNALSSGSVTLEGGILRLGNTHTLQAARYTQNKDAILALRVKKLTGYDQLVVNGNANLGGTLLLEGKPSNFGKEMPLVTTKGLNGSRFDNIQLAQTSLKKLSANYDANNVYVTSHFVPIYPYAVSRNARALARNLDLFSNTGRKEDLFDSLADLTLKQVPVALEKLVPDQVFVLSSIGFSVGRFQMLNLRGRLEDLNSVSYGQLNASAPKQYGLSSAGVSTQANFLMSKDQDLWNFYMRGNGSFGRQGQDTENEVVGYDYGQGGTFIGADHPLNDKVYVGGAVSYAYTDASFHGDRGSLSTDSYFAHLYAAFVQPKGFNVISSLSFGNHEFDLKRRALTDTAHSQPQSREVDFQTQVSYNILLKPNFTISPYAGLTHSTFWMNEFQEYNSQTNLKISNDQTNSLQSTVGVTAKYEKPFTKGIRKASVETNLAWEHEYSDTQTRGINAKWVGGGVPSFRVHGGRIGPDTLLSGVNFRLWVTNLFSIIIGYDIGANPDYVSHSFSVGANLAF